MGFVTGVEALIGPTPRCGFSVKDGLLGAHSRQVGGNPIKLPHLPLALLPVCLTQLFQIRDSLALLGYGLRRCHGVCPKGYEHQHPCGPVLS